MELWEGDSFNLNPIISLQRYGESTPLPQSQSQVKHKLKPITFCLQVAVVADLISDLIQTGSFFELIHSKSIKVSG